MKIPARLLLWVFFGFHFQFVRAEDPKPDASPEPAAPAPVTASRWDRISFPAMTSWRMDITSPQLTMQNKGKEGMVLALQYYLPSAYNQRKRGKSSPEAATAQLFLNENRPVTLKSTLESQFYMGSGPDPRYRELLTIHKFTIPWGPNALDDAWVQLRLKDRSFWVELPYGITRDPEAPAAPPDGKRGRPSSPLQRIRAGREDVIIPWESVTYTLELGDDKTLAVNLSNPFDSMAELVLGGFSGDIREPKTSVVQLFGPENQKEGFCISMTLAKYFSDADRSQMFAFWRNGGEGRGWCPVKIAVGKEERTLTVPSSLILYVHGHAEVPAGVTKLKPADKWIYHL